MEDRDSAYFEAQVSLLVEQRLAPGGLHGANSPLRVPDSRVSFYEQPLRFGSIKYCNMRNPVLEFKMTKAVENSKQNG
eukprot:6006991-Amphidinium_carterae.1